MANETEVAVYNVLLLLKYNAAIELILFGTFFKHLAPKTLINYKVVITYLSKFFSKETFFSCF